MSFRRQVLEEVGGFNSLLTNNYDDVEICARLIDSGHQISVLQDALVEHDRAPNAARDSPDDISDPYPLLYCRSVFALQCRQPRAERREIVEALRGAAGDMIGLADSYFAQGKLTATDRDVFIERAERGIEDGLEAGSGTRPTVAFEPASRALFRPYR